MENQKKKKTHTFRVGDKVKLPISDFFSYRGKVTETPSKERTIILTDEQILMAVPTDMLVLC